MKGFGYTCMSTCLSVAACLAAAPSDALGARARRTTAIRGIGSVRAEATFFRNGEDRSSWTTMTLEGSSPAAACGSKLVADLLGFGGIRRSREADHACTALELDGVGHCPQLEATDRLLEHLLPFPEAA